MLLFRQATLEHTRLASITTFLILFYLAPRKEYCQERRSKETIPSMESDNKDGVDSPQAS